MALTLEQIEEQIETIILSMGGPLRVDFQGRTEISRDSSDLLKALQFLYAQRAALLAATATTVRSVVIEQLEGDNP